MNAGPEHLDQLTAYLDGELTDAQCAEVERLLASDPAARDLYESLRRTASLVRDLPRVKAPDDLAAVVRSRMERAELLGAMEPRSPRPRRLFASLALAASLAMAATAGWYVYVGRDVPKTGETMTLADSESAHLKKVPATPFEERAPGSRAIDSLRLSKAAPKGSALEDKEMVEASRTASPPAPAASAANSPSVGKSAAGWNDTVARKGGSKADGDAPVQTIGGQVAQTDIAMQTLQVQQERAGPFQTDAPELGFVPATAFEQQVAVGGCSNEVLQQAQPDQCSNRLLIVCSDVPAQRQIVDQVQTFLRENRIPDARTPAVPDPIAAGQVFYVQNTRPPNSPPNDADTDAHEVSWVMNAPPTQVESLVASMAEAAVRGQENVQVLLNDAPAEEPIQARSLFKQTERDRLAPSDPAGWVDARLRAVSADDEAGGEPTSQTDQATREKAGFSGGAAKTKSGEVGKDRGDSQSLDDESAQRPRAAGERIDHNKDETGPPSADRAATQPAAEWRRGFAGVQLGRATTTTAPANILTLGGEPRVTMAVCVRFDPGLREQLYRQNVRQRFGRPTTQAQSRPAATQSGAREQGTP